MAVTWTRRNTFPRRSVRTAVSNQLVAQTCDAATIPGTPGISAGFIYFCKVYVDQAIAAGNAYMGIPATVGVGCVNSFIGVYDPASGALLAETGDVSAGMMTAAVLKAPLTPALAMQPINKKLWLAVLIGSYTSSPGFVGTNQSGTNLGLTDDFRLWLSDSHGFTTLPSTAPAMSAASNTQAIPYISIGP